MSNKIIFISCGQQTEEEKALGKAVKDLVNATPGLEGYFAATVHSTQDLCTNIFEALRRCSGLIAFLHDRGAITDAQGQQQGHRSSVWVNQEMAVLVYWAHLTPTQIPLLVFKDSNVRLEGMTEHLASFVETIGERPQVLEKIDDWLSSHTFTEPGEDGVFHSKWDGLSENYRKLLNALVDLKGKQVNESSLRKRLVEHYDISKSDVGRLLMESKSALSQLDFIRFAHTYTGGEWTLHPAWEWHIRRAIVSEAQS
ncbi:MAG: hypothetical protein GTN65_02450 [Armatimonadetes bacterium]|nr:hypothetical protein [Armatimonadota bacterium]NIO95967.1 hypothetical protein [Armatimonadota bacterium]